MSSFEKRRCSGGRRLRPGEIRPAGRTAASSAQQRKVAGAACVVCGRVPSDPAHLVPQRLGGCELPECVVALCRTHHRLFDSARLALTPYLGDEHARELAHALTHVREAELRAALDGGGWPPPWLDEPKRKDDR